MNKLLLLAIILFIILGFCFIVNYYRFMNIESFDTFSPYSGNCSYPFVYKKNADQYELRKTLKSWEKPFNTNNEGYWWTQLNERFPPLVPLYNYEDMKQVRFKE